MKQPWFACRDVFPILMVPVISRVAQQCPPHVCVGQGGEGFLLNWEELGHRREKEMQIPAPVQ